MLKKIFLKLIKIKLRTFYLIVIIILPWVFCVLHKMIEKLSKRQVYSVKITDILCV